MGNPHKVIVLDVHKGHRSFFDGGNAIACGWEVAGIGRHGADGGRVQARENDRIAAL